MGLKNKRTAKGCMGRCYFPCVTICVLLLVLVSSRMCPVYWKIPWFASRLRHVTPGDAIVVTGASTGIGKHAALTLAKEGYTVFCGIRKSKDGVALLKSATEHNISVQNIKPILMDVTNATQIEQAWLEVSSFLNGRGLSGIFNNAGVGGEASTTGGSNAVEHQSMSTYRWVMDVNFFGVVEVTKRFLDLLRKAKGRIIINTSVDGFMGTPFQSTYVASKFAVEGWADSLHREISYSGMHVAVLEPGFVASHIIQKQADSHGVDVKMKYDMENYPHEEAWWDVFWKLSVQSSSPRVTSEAVVHAFRAKSPARRYLCGFGSQFMRFTPSFPDEMKDLFYHRKLLNPLMSWILPQTSADVIREAAVSGQREFEL